jgi:hypothetical protein
VDAAAGEMERLEQVQAAMAWGVVLNPPPPFSRLTGCNR